MIKKSLAIAIISAATLMALPAFAMSYATGSGDMMTQKTNAMMSANASAQTVACVAGAVNTREQSLDSAIAVYTQALSSAYSARASALQTAYGQTSGNSAIKTAVKAAWSTFTASVKSARTAWQSARSSSWNTFRTAAKACKAPSAITDSGASSMESSGQ